MHVFSIPSGTVGKLISRLHDNLAVNPWTTRRDLMFSEAVVDPVIYHNNRGNLNLPSEILRLAERGYAVYGGEFGNDASAPHLLAVPYDQVEVL